MNFFTLFLTIFGLEAGVRAIVKTNSSFLKQLCFGNKEFHGERMVMIRSGKLIEKSESHIVIFFLLWLLLLLGRSSFSSSGSSSSSSRSSSSGSGSRSYSRPHRGDEGLEVAGLKSLGEESGPVWLNFNTGSLDDGGQLLWSDGHVCKSNVNLKIILLSIKILTIISKDESSVDTGKFRRHVGDYAQVSW